MCSWAGTASRADCAIPWTTAAIQKINKNQSLNGQNRQVKAFASFFPVCPFCQLSNDIYYKTFKCQLRSFCGQLYSLSLPINFQQLTMMMICGGGKTLSSLGQLKRAVKWSVFCLRLFSFSFSSLFLFGPVFVSFHLAQQIAVWAGMMSYRIDNGWIGCQVGSVRGCALTEMLRGVLKISYF